jgi:uncharacterized membrane protein
MIVRPLGISSFQQANGQQNQSGDDEEFCIKHVLLYGWEVVFLNLTVHYAKLWIKTGKSI